MNSPVNSYSDNNLYVLLKAMRKEFKKIASIHPDLEISLTKVEIVNRLLENIRNQISNEDSLKFLDLVNREPLPQASDVALILSQYAAVLKSLYKKEQQAAAAQDQAEI